MKKTMHANFFHFLSHVFRAIPPDDEFTQAGQKKLCIKPNPSLKFPIRDVSHLEETDDEFIILCQFMGLYGVDSPLPAYFNEHCLRATEINNSLCDLLDVFNHRSYVLFYQAWRAFQPEPQDLKTQSDFQALTRSLSRDRPFVLHRSAYQEVTTRSGFLLELQNFLPSGSVAIKEYVPVWEKVVGVLSLGKMMRLGDNSMLGERIYDGVSHLQIIIKPLTGQQLESLLPGSEWFTYLLESIRRNLSFELSFDIKFVVPEPETQFYLSRSKIYLGRTSWLGFSLRGEETITVHSRDIVDTFYGRRENALQNANNTGTGHQAVIS